MVKRIFAVIGIVLASVTAFTGAVFGVMALMGKFKTPTVYPTELFFEFEEMTVVERIPYAGSNLAGVPEDKLPTLYQFVLVGNNPDEETAVNQTECYLLIKDSNTQNLITICDANRVPLEVDSKNRYLVDCNSPIYFMVNEIAENGMIDGVKTDGKAVLYARSTNDTIKAPDKPLIINIDRAVEEVAVLGGEDVKTENGKKTQLVRRAISQDLIFDYSVKTELAHKPISTQNAKVIELYYDAKGSTTDYVKVTEENVNNSASPLHSILKYEDGKFVFASSTPGDYTFYAAIFPTYEDETKYYKNIEGMVFESPNYHKVQNMLTTELTVQVSNIEITEVGFNKDSVALDLNSQNDYITLDKENAIDGANNNNLGLYMKKGEQYDTTRFDEVNMNGFNASVWAGESTDIIFTNAESYIGNGSLTVSGTIGNLTIELEHETTKEKEDFTIQLSNLALSESLVVVDYLLDEGEHKYYCYNGAVVFDVTTNKLKLLRSGSYLNFYIKTTESASTSYAIVGDEFDYVSKPNTSLFGKEKTWQIISKTLPSPNDNQVMQLGILIVNNTGKFDVENYFKTINVSVNKVDWKYSVNAKINMSITFDNNGAVYTAKPFNELVTTTQQGSFMAGVFVVKEADKEKVETLPISVKYNEETYYIVGYRNEDNKFVNAIKPKSGVTKDDTIDLFVLQFKNIVDETIEDIIERYFPADYDTPITDKLLTVENDRILEIDASGNIVDKVSDLTIDYTLNEDGLEIECVKGANTPEVEFKDGAYNLYENTGLYEIKISSNKTGMLKTLCEFYSPLIADITVGNDAEENVDIDSIAYDGTNDIVIIKFGVKGTLFNTNTIIGLRLNNIGGEIALPNIRILDGSPDEIVFNAIENATDAEKFTLSDTDDVEQNQNYIKMVVSYNSGYEYKYYIIIGATGTEITGDIFNNAISSMTAKGFQGAEDKGQNYEIEYSSLSEEILKISATGEGADRTINTQIAGFGTAVVQVKIKNAIKYFRLDVEAGGNGFKLEAASTKTTKDETFYLKNDVQFYYDDGIKNQIDLKADNLITISNIRINSYGDGDLTPDSTGLIFKDEKGTTILTISDDSTNGWEFVKAKMHIPLQITFTINSIVGSKDMTLIFESSITVSVNNGWNEKENRVLYAGTQVTVSGTDGIFDARSETAGTFSFEINGSEMGETYIVGANYEGYGSNDIIVKFEGTEVERFKFEIRPNVFATIKNNKLKSETAYSIVDLYEFKKFDTDEKTYGSTHYYDKTYYTDDTYITTTTDVTEFWKYTNAIDLTIDASKCEIATRTETNPTIDWNKTETQKLYVGAMTELDTTYERTLTLKYLDYAISTDIISVTNKYIVSKTLVAGSNCEEKDKQIFKVMKSYDVFVSVDGFTITNIEADNLSFDYSSGFRITTPVLDKWTDVEVTFTFEEDGGTQILTYKTKITILPYTPNENKDDKVYSGSEIDLLKAFYIVQYDSGASDYSQSINGDANIKKVIVEGIVDAKGNDITSEVIEGTFVANGYTEGIAGANCIVNLKEIVGDKKEVFVKFKVTYKGEGINNVEYSYELPLTINNRQSLYITYAEDNLGGNANTLIFNFNSAYTQDALELSKQITENASGMYQVTVLDYEAICVTTGEKITIDLTKIDENKKVVRALAQNLNNVNNSLNLTVELIAYENQRALYQNISKISTATNQIILDFTSGVNGSGFFGTVIFKISTESGNYGYYYIYLYNKNSLTNVDVSNNLDVVACSNTNPYSNDENLIKVDISGDKTYHKLVSGLGTTFTDKFGKEFSANTTKLFLYNGVRTGGEFDYSGKQWQEIRSSDAVTQNTYFNTITIGLMYYSGLERYVYGTITLYVQPNVDVSTSGLSYDKPNGEFTKEIANTESEILNPFTDWTATIESIENSNVSFKYSTGDIVVINGKKIECFDDNSDGIFDRIKVNGVESVDADLINEYAEIYKNARQYYDALLTLDTDGKITLNQRVLSETYIRVKYQSENTIAFVTYTFEATEIPTDEELSSKQFIVGSWDSKAFANTVDLSGPDYSGNYSGNIKVYYKNAEVGSTITDDGDKISFNSGTKELTFTQTTKQWNVTLKIKYVDLEGTPERSFTFVVKSGVYLDTSDTSSTSGLTEGKRCVTTPTDSYDAEVGSTLNVTADTSKKEWTIAGLVIHTNNESKLKLTFSDGLYVLDDSDNDGIINCPNTTTVKFPHLAQATALNVKVRILNSSGAEYASRNLYLTVARTYQSLEVKYLAEQGNNAHENITNGKEIDNLHTEILDRLSLYNLKGYNITAKIKNIGFDDETNPNYLEFSCSENGTPKYTGDNVTGIQFATVSKNTLCDVGITNKAGIGNLTYTYQIMVSGKYVDGLDYTATNGIYVPYDSQKEPSYYISFMMNDSDKDQAFEVSGENAYVIGKMLDTYNQTAFIVTGATINGSGLSGGLDEIEKGEDDYDENKVSWKFGNSYYTFTVYLDKADSKVKLDVSRAVGADIENIILTISLGGVNGGTTIAENLTIYLSKDSVALRNIGTQYYTANHTVDLKNEFKENNQATIKDLNLTYELAESTYNADGKVYTIVADGNNNLLFDFDTTKKQLKLHSVGETVSATINFNVKSGVYLIGSISLKLSIGLNLQVVANGESLQQNIGNRNLETNFVITTEQDADKSDGLPIKIYFSHWDTFNEADDYSSDCYRKLVYDLYFLSKEGIETPTDSQLRTGYGNINISTYDGTNVGDGWTINKDGSEYYIQFNKDFSGDIVLVLEVNASVGTYVVDWTIHVEPVINVAYANVGAETIKLTNSSLPFNSKASVAIIAPSKGDGVGITMQTQTAFKQEVEKTITYNYKVFEKNSTTEYTKNGKLYAGTGLSAGTLPITSSLKKNEYSLSINLPNVPGTSLSVGKSYYVVYELTVTYLNVDTTYYVAYEVVNYQGVDTYTYVGDDGNAHHSTIVNVSELTDDQLNLFYYKQTYTVDTTTYDFTYENGKIVMNKSGEATSYDGSIDSDNKYVFTNDYTLDLSGVSAKLFNDSGAEITGGTWTSVKRIDGETVFESQFSNIAEYKSFIDQFIGTKVVKLTDATDHNFTLKYNSTAYGIELRENGGELFNNTMDASLSLMIGDITAVYVPAYTEASKSGFRLHANVTLTPVSGYSHTLDSMFLDSYLTDVGVSKSTYIIGVGSPDPGWVENAKSVSTGTKIGTINVEGVTYNLYSATWTGDGAGLYYTISEVFHYIYKSDIDSEVYLPNYSAVSIETDHFRVSFPNNINDKDDSIILDLSNGVKKWYMSDNVLTSENEPATITQIVSDDDDFESENFTIGGSKIIIKAGYLAEYKKDNREEYLLSTTITITNGGNKTCKVVFVLPTLEEAEKLLADVAT